MAADNPSPVGVLEFGRAILHDEARALDALADGLGEPFERAVSLKPDEPIDVLHLHDCVTAR